MKLKKNIFDRLSLKKRISLNKQNKLSDQLFLESKKNSVLIEQIKDLQNNRNKDDTGLRSAYLLKSQNWYSQKLTEELDQKVTKQSFIEKEIKELQQKIAIEHQNMTKALTTADETRKKEAASLETKRELMTPKINKL